MHLIFNCRDFLIDLNCCDFLFHIICLHTISPPFSVCLSVDLCAKITSQDLDFAHGDGAEDPDQEHLDVNPFGGHNEHEAGPAPRWTLRGDVLVLVDEDRHE